MKLNKVLKGLFIALPVLTLAACSSTSSTDQSGADTSNMPQETVQVETVEQAMSPAEQMRQKLEALRQENTIYFDFDKATVRPEFIETLQAHGAFLTANPSVRVTIEGHSDERGTPEYNIALGERRAQAVVQYLQNLGVSAGQISTVSYGEEKPVDMSRTEAGFAKNRRAVLVY
ncbi:peptidoglycan-associated lipoprotein Pal [Rheinheimera aquimaris]|jgi:peptidoglycan-associated lipoprotein|uniref:peptidoglycan-associated lipoprotein Pal n=1 Tax=Rheinheimera aquimaris TaxID=412437 RepID=UPI000E919506|nr:peptidoglycan-associated lipoprotein Pal [Rheinheimera aquimaris]MCD1597851.1 peptidoglycan-associated lipoprotein Pal [Rheinheimera aquimaris]HBN88680.1 peptidoglycan-associated lipoprotein Pal [Rheinheimera sp.]|tara:strand:+ start:3323 stop:3844 length:522 start_codon:yes stop_codon:yes gene_type:complete